MDPASKNDEMVKLEEAMSKAFFNVNQLEESALDDPPTSLIPFHVYIDVCRERIKQSHLKSLARHFPHLYKRHQALEKSTPDFFKPENAQRVFQEISISRALSSHIQASNAQRWKQTRSRLEQPPVREQDRELIERVEKTLRQTRTEHELMMQNTSSLLIVFGTIGKPFDDKEALLRLSDPARSPVEGAKLVVKSMVKHLLADDQEVIQKFRDPTLSPTEGVRLLSHLSLDENSKAVIRKVLDLAVSPSEKIKLLSGLFEILQNPQVKQMMEECSKVLDSANSAMSPIERVKLLSNFHSDMEIPRVERNVLGGVAEQVSGTKQQLTQVLSETWYEDTLNRGLPDLSALDDFEHQCLPNGSSIRVLRLQDNVNENAQKNWIILTSEVIDLHNNPKFNALSYVWGDHRPPLAQTSNLDRAQRRFDIMYV